MSAIKGGPEPIIALLLIVLGIFVAGLAIGHCAMESHAANSVARGVGGSQGWVVAGS